ncbi:hypothetical protein [Streptomyces syringium]|uniref:hypothetical protein n=1 Tax=Streptomyces syringium TaxID=76729 RepID=UPI003454EA2D
MSRYLTMALKEAARSDCRFKVGAVLAKGGRVLGRSCNRQRNSALIDGRHATFHAEEVLMRNTAPPRGSVVYIARLSKTGAPLLARPCPRCQGLLASHGIALARYTTSIGSGTLHMP